MTSLRLAYSTINWGETPDMAAAFAEIRDAGWHAVELFNHSLDWLGSPERRPRRARRTPGRNGIRLDRDPQ